MIQPNAASVDLDGNGACGEKSRARYDRVFESRSKHSLVTAVTACAPEFDPSSPFLSGFLSRIGQIDQLQEGSVRIPEAYESHSALEDLGFGHELDALAFQLLINLGHVGRS